MQKEQKKHESLPVIRDKKDFWGVLALGCLIAAAVLWGIHFLVNLDALRKTELIKSAALWLEDHGLVRLLVNLVRFGAAAAALWAGSMFAMYTYHWLMRKNPGGNAAALDEALADEAMRRLERLHAACDDRNCLKVRDTDVRVQVLTPLAEGTVKDYLVQWDEDDSHRIELGGGRAITLMLNEDRLPCIVGLENIGTDAQPRWKEDQYLLQPHVPLVIVRGEGREQRLRYAITRLY